MTELVFPGDWDIDVTDKTERGRREIFLVATRIDGARSPIHEEVILSGNEWDSMADDLPSVEEAFQYAKSRLYSRVVEAEKMVQRDRTIAFEIDKIRKEK